MSQVLLTGKSPLSFPFPRKSGIKQTAGEKRISACIDQEICNTYAFLNGLNKESQVGVTVKILRVLCLATVVLFLHISPLIAEPTTEKTRDIKTLLEVSGIKDQLVYMRDSLLNSYSLILTGSYPNIPDEFWEEYNQVIGAKELDELVDRIIHVYDKHMSHEVIRKLITMFDTPFWREWKDKMPEISREAGALGSQWGQELVESPRFTEKIDQLLKKYHLEAPSSPSSAEKPKQ
jgi:hypothetical protein